METLTSRQKKALETREKLLKASLDLFNKHGYESCFTWFVIAAVYTVRNKSFPTIFVKYFICS